MKIFIIALLVLIIAALISAFLPLVNEQKPGRKVVNRLALRVGLSALLLVTLYIHFSMGGAS